MSTTDIENVNVTAFDPMPTPEDIHSRLPLSLTAAHTVMHGRATLRAILERTDPRLFASSAPARSTTRSPASITPAASRRWPTKSAARCS